MSVAPTSFPPSGSVAELRQVAVPGRRLAVHRSDPPGGAAAATAPPVLLLHGVPQTSACWIPLIQELADDRVVLAVDLPGLGDSEVRGPYDVPSIVASLFALLLAELSEPGNSGSNSDSTDDTADTDDTDDDVEPAPLQVDVVGHDWGGSIALALAAARPGLVRRLVVASAPYRKVDLIRAWHIPVLGFVPPVGFARSGRAIVRGMFRYAWKTGRAPEATVASYADAYAAPERVRAMTEYYRAAVRRASSKRTAEDGDGGPAARAERSLVIWGTDDPPMPLRVGEAVVSDLGRVNDPATVRMVTLPGVGHWPFDEVPGVVVPLVGDFLRR
jgi:haloacetate dehalogenase